MTTAAATRPPTADIAALVDRVRELTGHKHLTADEARERYGLVLAVLANPGCTQAWLARALGCTDSNVSRLVADARQALIPDEYIGAPQCT